jgi:hypothetical protein
MRSACGERARAEQPAPAPRDAAWHKEAIVLRPGRPMGGAPEVDASLTELEPPSAAAAAVSAAAVVGGLVRRLVLSQHVGGDATAVGDFEALSASPCPDVGLVVPGRAAAVRCPPR